MIPLFTFEPEEKAHLLNLLEPLDLSPYKATQVSRKAYGACTPMCPLVS